MKEEMKMMMRYKRKGQGAMEYLMTYGWAILVVMIVGVVLWQLGIFGGGPGAANTARGFGRIKVMEPSIKYTSDASPAANFMFTVMNGAGTSTADMTYMLNESTGGGTCTVVGTNPTTLSAGETALLSYSCPGQKAGGESFSVDVQFGYNITVAGSKVWHDEKGTIRGSVEPI